MSLLFNMLSKLVAGVQPQQDPGVPSGWEAQYKRLLVWKCAIIVVFFNLNILVKWHVRDLF